MNVVCDGRVLKTGYPTSSEFKTWLSENGFTSRTFSALCNVDDRKIRKMANGTKPVAFGWFALRNYEPKKSDDTIRDGIRHLADSERLSFPEYLSAINAGCVATLYNRKSTLGWAEMIYRYRLLKQK